MTIHELERRDKRGRWSAALALLLSICLLFASWMGLFTFMTASAAANSWQALDDKYLPEVDGQSLILPDLSQVSRVYAADGTLLAELHDGRLSEPVRFEDMPPEIVYAVIAAEDSTFFEHEGVNWGAILKAFLDNLSSGRQRGGSTITQQVVKNIFVGDEVSYERKIKEAVTAIEFERRYEKEQILEFYMNSVYFGWSAYGVKAAAREFFGKSLADLTVAEAATLAVLPRNPSEYNPRRDPDFVLERRNDVIANMLDEGFISQAVADEATAAELGVIDHVGLVLRNEHIVAEVTRQLLNDPQFDFLGRTKDERKQRIYGCSAADATCTGGGGLEIFTTIDLQLHEKAVAILQDWLPTPDDPTVQAPTGAIAMVDNHTGAVLVMASGLPFEDEQFDLVVQGRRNPGSAFKPITLVTALERGISLNSFWDATSPKEIECPGVCFPDGIWTVRGSGGDGLMALERATYASQNVVYAQVALAAGAQNIVDTGRRMGIRQSTLTPEPSITLGTSAVSPLEMASAFSNFATNGQWAAPYLVSSITSRDGQVSWEHRLTIEQNFDPALMAAARQPLEVVPVSGTAPRANIGRPQGGKTGTHQTYREAWYVGFVPQYSAAVWVGFPDAQIPLENVTIKGEVYRRVFGGTIPAPIWKEFMEAALANKPVLEFPPDPPGVANYLKVPNTAVPYVVGLPSEEAIELILDSHLDPVIEPVNSLVAEGTVLAQDLDALKRVPHATPLVIGVSTGLPPEAPIPALLGLTQQGVDAALTIFAEETGVELSYLVEFRTTADPAEIGVVVATQPGSGSVVQTGQTIIIVIGRP